MNIFFLREGTRRNRKREKRKNILTKKAEFREL